MAKRRGHGEGSIYKRKDGLWVAAVSVGTRPDGSRDRRSLYAKTRQEALEKKRQLEREIADTGLVSTEQVTVEAVLRRWLEMVVKRKHGADATTYHTYTYQAEHYLIPALGKRLVKKLTAGEVDQFISQQLESRASSTVNLMRSVLIQALTYAVKHNLVGRNVASMTTPPPAPDFVPTTYTREQLHTLVQAVRGHRLEALYVLAVETGMREGEILGLRWGAIDFDAGTLHVRAALKVRKGGLQLGAPKTKAGNRTIPLSDRLADVLAAHYKRQSEEQAAADGPWNVDGYVFTTQTGKPIHPRSLLIQFKRLIQRAGLPDIRFHDLRHSYGEQMVDAGTHPTITQALMGHADSRTTLTTYSHASDAAKREAVNTASRRLHDDDNET